LRRIARKELLNSCEFDDSLPFRLGYIAEAIWQTKKRIRNLKRIRIVTATANGMTVPRSRTADMGE
jgi:hypothetical protein